MKSRLAWLALAGVLLAGCAAFNSLTVYVSSTGDWPVERKPGEPTLAEPEPQASSRRPRAAAPAEAIDTPTPAEPRRLDE